MKHKKVFKWFTIFDYEKEQDYLRNMHKSGWKFVKANFHGRYIFEECVPEDVIYQLDYNQEGIKNKDEYIKLFNDCGWEYLQDLGGYSYFRKHVSESGEAEEIFCDEESRFQMMKRVIKGRLIPLLIIFFCGVLPHLVLDILRHRYIFVALFGGLLILCLYIFISFIIKYREYKKKLKR